MDNDGWKDFPAAAQRAINTAVSQNAVSTTIVLQGDRRYVINFAVMRQYQEDDVYRQRAIRSLAMGMGGSDSAAAGSSMEDRAAQHQHQHQRMAVWKCRQALRAMRVTAKTLVDSLLDGPEKRSARCEVFGVRLALQRLNRVHGGAGDGGAKVFAADPGKSKRPDSADSSSSDPPTPIQNLD